MDAESRDRQRPALPDRKHPAHGVYVPASGPCIVFITVCTRHRHPWLASDEVHVLTREMWSKAPGWLVGRYVLMPDHVHFFAGLGSPEVPLERWMRRWKARFTQAHGVAAHRWQTDHWDRRLRSAESYEQKWEYVRNNPVRRVLVARAEDWPYQGELNRLEW